MRNKNKKKVNFLKLMYKNFSSNKRRRILKKYTLGRKELG
tara:strand:- start:369 stop:488 length:120 start_codon:yes stop_codon:yes gene_type:complete